jgi:hypothetical protein
MQRFPAPREGSSLHLEALEGRCMGHSFTVDAAGRLFIKTKVLTPIFISAVNRDEQLYLGAIFDDIFHFYS